VGGASPVLVPIRSPTPPTEKKGKKRGSKKEGRERKKGLPHPFFPPGRKKGKMGGGEVLLKKGKEEENSITSSNNSSEKRIGKEKKKRNREGRDARFAWYSSFFLVGEKRGGRGGGEKGRKPAPSLLINKGKEGKGSRREKKSVVQRRRTLSLNVFLDRKGRGGKNARRGGRDVSQFHSSPTGKKRGKGGKGAKKRERGGTTIPIKLSVPYNKNLGVTE